MDDHHAQIAEFQAYVIANQISISDYSTFESRYSHWREDRQRQELTRFSKQLLERLGRTELDQTESNACVRTIVEVEHATAIRDDKQENESYTKSQTPSLGRLGGGDPNFHKDSDQEVSFMNDRSNISRYSPSIYETASEHGEPYHNETPFEQHRLQEESDFDRNMAARESEQCTSEEEFISNDTTMPLPPLGTYTTMDQAVDAINDFALKYHWHVIRGRTKKNGKKWLYCAYSKPTYKVKTGDRKRHSSTNKVECPFQLWLLPDNKDDLANTSWTTHYPTDPTRLQHRHRFHPTVNGTTALQRRRIRKTNGMQDSMMQALQSGLTNKQFMAIISNEYEEDHRQTSRDVENMRTRVLTDLRGADSIVTSVIKKLNDGKYIWKIDTTDAEDEGEQSDAIQSTEVEGPKLQRMKRLFFLHPLSVELLKKHHDAIFLDCTYKTTRYGLPLLNIVGVTGYNTTFNIGFCFLAKEATVDFDWAMLALHGAMTDLEVCPKIILVDRDRACLAAVKAVFPQCTVRICAWHMNKDVRAWVFKRLPSEYDPLTGEKVMNPTAAKFIETFYGAINAPTREEFDRCHNALDVIYPEGFLYLNRNWFHEDFVPHIAAHQLNLVCTYGYQSTSRVEGNHYSLKSWLRNSAKNLQGFMLALEPWWKMMARELQDKEDRQRKAFWSEIPGHEKPYYEGICGRITKYALKLVLKEDKFALAEIEKLKDEPGHTMGSCPGIWPRQWGIPCRHQLFQRRMQGQPLKLREFASHWYVNRSSTAITTSAPAECLILEPRKIARRRTDTARHSGPRPRRGTTQLSTGRDGLARDSLYAESIPGALDFSISTPREGAHSHLRRAAATNITVVRGVVNSIDLSTQPLVATISNHVAQPEAPVDSQRTAPEVSATRATRPESWIRCFSEDSEASTASATLPASALKSNQLDTIIRRSPIKGRKLPARYRDSPGEDESIESHITTARVSKRARYTSFED